RHRPCSVGADELVQRDGRAGDAMTNRATLLLRFARRRLFATPLDAVITLVCCWVLVRLAEPLARWFVVDATFRGTTRADCTGTGACWVFIRARLGQFIYGFYPLDQRWRVDLVAVLLIACATLLVIKRQRGAIAAGLAVVMPPLAIFLFYGGFGLPV